MPSRLAALPPRVGALPVAQSEPERLKQRDRDHAWRVWYKTARWQKLRLLVLDRDGWQCRQTGVMLIGKYPAPDSAVVDHIEPHHGDEAMFWNSANLQAVAKAYHDGEKQRIEAAQGFR